MIHKLNRSVRWMFFCMCIASLGLVGCTPQSVVHRKWGFIDKNGKLVIPFRFDDVDLDTYGGFEDPNLGHFLPKPFANFREGLCAVRVDDHWGYIDKTGRLVIPAQYDEAGAFSEGLAFVRKSRQCGYVDRTGKLVIKLGLPPWMSATPSTLSPSES